MSETVTKPEYVVLTRLQKIFPGTDRKLLKKIIWKAHEISCKRRDSPEFHKETVLSVIRGNFRKIRRGLGKFPVEELFAKEEISPKKYPIRPPPDPMSVLLPNETWAGKGSAGKNNISVQ